MPSLRCGVDPKTLSAPPPSITDAVSDSDSTIPAGDQRRVCHHMCNAHPFPPMLRRILFALSMLVASVFRVHAQTVPPAGGATPALGERVLGLLATGRHAAQRWPQLRDVAPVLRPMYEAANRQPLWSRNGVPTSASRLAASSADANPLCAAVSARSVSASTYPASLRPSSKADSWKSAVDALRPRTSSSREEAFQVCDRDSCCAPRKRSMASRRRRGSFG